MKPKMGAWLSVLLATACTIGATPVSGQEKLDRSEIWYAQALRQWFNEKIPLGRTEVYLGRLAVCPDITKFEFETGLVSFLDDRAFQVKGALRLGALPMGFEVLDGSKGRKYVLHLQGYIFSPSGERVWMQNGNPTSPWVDRGGGTVTFSLIGPYTGPVSGYHGAVVAYGDPLLVKSTSDTRVLLGMNWFSLDSRGQAIKYGGPRPRSENVANRVAEAGAPPRRELSYIEGKVGSTGWKYTEVVGLAETERRKIFRELVLYQDRTGDDAGSHAAIAKRFGIPEKAVAAISGEGLANGWPLP